ncbi:hypothetical protein SLEP1_g10557 [Rubroshorea leprosula]|uniref:Uncharacterized protein n=1 Tax=Rubroshorea leprosula TaxID=152421 RepID=A0AAV5IEC9_9ROSI|nr:hypothetical protein SLEP1_g10557 [Rubroshorea leprosula]
MGEVEVTLELALELQERADSVMKAVNPHADYAYEEVPFHVSLRDYNEYLYETDINEDSFSAADE